MPRKARPAEIPGVGDRALLRTEETGEDGERSATPAASSRSSTAPSSAQLGIFRALPNGGGRLVPVDKKQLGRELDDPAGRHRATPQDGDLVAVEVAPRRAASACRPRASKERLGSLKSERAVSLIAIHAHGIPHVFPPRGAGARPKRRGRPRSQGREDWRDVPLVTIDPADAKDHDDAVYAEPDPDPDNRGRLHRHASRSPTSRTT